DGLAQARLITMHGPFAELACSAIRLSAASRPRGVEAAPKPPIGVQMARLIYSAITSLDGYVEDREGKFDWAAPDDEVHACINDLEREIGTYLYGRRMYETMVFWETASTGADQPAVIRDFAEAWRAAEKIVYSRTLQTLSSARTRIEHDFDPGAITRLQESSDRDITIGR